jgi:Lrp/AsnC family leucine-responsive transcriptional regulator
MTPANRLSENDARILEVLQRDGRRPYAELGAEVGISGPSAHERVKKLESRGVIQGYAAIVDPRAIGYDILAFSWIIQAPGTTSIDLTDAFAAIPEIEELNIGHSIVSRSVFVGLDRAVKEMREAMRALGVSRQTVLQRVKRGELEAVHVMRGKQKGLRIKVIARQPGLFDPTT